MLPNAPREFARRAIVTRNKKPENNSKDIVINFLIAKCFSDIHAVMAACGRL